MLQASATSRRMTTRCAAHMATTERHTLKFISGPETRWVLHAPQSSQSSLSHQRQSMQLRRAETAYMI